MRLTRIFFALLICSIFFISCTVDDVESDNAQTQTGEIQATGDNENNGDNDKSNNG